MIHVAVEQCRPGDVLVVATNSPSTDGLFGELFATALAQRGVRGVVLGCGVRDVAELREMGFPVWSRAVSAQGTVKATAGAVNVPVVLGGQTIHPGDVVVADDDGVMVVPRADVPRALTASQARVDKEAASRAAFRGASSAGPLRPARQSCPTSASSTSPTRRTRKETAVTDALETTRPSRRALHACCAAAPPAALYFERRRPAGRPTADATTCCCG